MQAGHATNPIARFDPGWLYVLAGVAAMVATVLIPAGEDAAQTRRRVQQARVWADHQTSRVERYSAYLDALDRGDPALLTSLASAHLNLAPAGKRAILISDPEGFARAPIDVFGEIEPAPPPPPTPRRPVDSFLGRLAGGERSRLAMLAASGVCILIGLLPPATRRRRNHTDATTP